MTSGSSAIAGGEPQPLALNHVHLVGRIAEPAAVRTLPSGDELAVFRVIVPRTGGRSPQGRNARGAAVDTVDCSTSSARVRRAVITAPAGAVVEITGSLRRRFWRGPTGPVSRYEVEVIRAKVLRKVAGAAGRAHATMPP